MERSRIQMIKKSYYMNGYSLSTIESPNYSFRSYWSERQNSLIKYLYETKSLLMNKNILVLFDGIGVCSIMIALIGGCVTIMDEEKYSSFINRNIEINLKENSPKFIHLDQENLMTSSYYDYIIVSEPIYSNNEQFQKIFQLIDKYSNVETKILLTIRKMYWEKEMFMRGEVRGEERGEDLVDDEDHTNHDDVLFHFPKKYSRKQISKLRSGENVVFELQKKKLSWLEDDLK